jgi:hypothetical protein
LQTFDAQEQPAFRKEAVFSAKKNPNKGNGQYWIVLPLAQNIPHYRCFLQAFI